MNEVILASQSPRRKALLTAMGVSFEAIPSKFDEKLDDEREPSEVAIELSLGKARDVAAKYPDAFVIGSDTIVTIDGQQLEKPADAEEAHDMLKLLCGRTNYVTTGLAVVCLNKDVQLTASDTTDVHFGPYDEDTIREYIATGDPLDKAGAYGVQTLLGTLITHVDGRMDTVVGMPTAPLALLLEQCGINARALTDEEIEILAYA